MKTNNSKPLRSRQPKASFAGWLLLSCVLLLFGTHPGLEAQTNIPLIINYTLLTPAGGWEAWALATSDSQQAGYVNFGWDYPYVTNHAVLWSGSAGSFVDLNPGTKYSWAYAAAGSKQAGAVEFGTTLSAALWSGSAGSFKNLSPNGGLYDSQVNAMSGSQQAGFAGFNGHGHAVIWAGSAASYADLHPAVASDSFIYATTGSKQAGTVWIGGAGTIHAALWSGTKESFVDLNPGGSTRSWAYAASGSQQAGYATINGYQHAALWSGTTNSFVDLDPGQNNSAVFAMAGPWEAGMAGGRACMWSGTPSSVVYLDTVLGPNADGYPYGGSEARGIWVSGRNIYVVGTALSYLRFVRYKNAAILWTIRDTEVYVDRAYAGTSSDGSLQAPYKTVTAGYQAAETNALITVFGGNYPETILMNKPLLLQATNGVVNIGIP